MGNDGGSIPKRRELVKEAVRTQSASEAKESQQEQHGYRWTTCAVSQRPLQAPVVSDYLGTLYNKDAILEFLLPSDDPDAEAAKADATKVLAGRVASLKDVVEVKFQEEDAGAETKSKSPTWVCPITNKQLGPGVKAAYIVPCGHAFSEIALKEVAELVCLQCNEAYSADNIVTILPLKEEDRTRLQKRIDDLKAQGLTHSLKKAANKKKRKNAETNGSAQETAATNGKSETLQTNGSSGIKNAATASLTAKVLAEEEAKSKRRKADTNATLKTLFTTGEKKRADGDFMTRGYSIPATAKR